MSAHFSQRLISRPKYLGIGRFQRAARRQKNIKSQRALDYTVEGRIWIEDSRAVVSVG